MSSKAVVLQTAGSGSLANHSHVQHCTTRSYRCGDVAAMRVVRLFASEIRSVPCTANNGLAGPTSGHSCMHAWCRPASTSIPPGVDPTSRFREVKLLRPILAPSDLHLPYEYHHGQLGAGQTGLSQAAVGRQHVIPIPTFPAPHSHPRGRAARVAVGGVTGGVTGGV